MLRRRPPRAATQTALFVAAGLIVVVGASLGGAFVRGDRGPDAAASWLALAEASRAAAAPATSAIAPLPSPLASPSGSRWTSTPL